MVDFTALKKAKGSNLQKLSKVVESMTSSNSPVDDSGEFWKIELDKSGNGYAVIRFLSTPPQDIDSDGLPWVKYYDHGFQGPGGWYIEKSLTSIGKEDPLSKYNSELWETGIEANKDQARKQKRRLHYVSNIYVIKDPKHPENEGKVFKYVYGKKIFEKITQAMNPQFEDEKPIDPFDLWTGANFKLKIKKVDGYQNYDSSEFDSSSALFEDDDKLEKIWKSEYSLLDILNEKNFKDYSVLDTRLKKVLGLTVSNLKYKNAEEYTSHSIEKSEDESFIKARLEESKTRTVKSEPEEEEDDDLAYFSNLLDD